MDTGPTTLPIDAAIPELLAALSGRGRAVLVAPPGAGKTTKVPLALLDAPWRGDGRIVMLEPRRLAARAAAHRMASLIGENVGETIGYRVRLDSRTSRRTRIEVVTEGVFTRMALDDAALTGVSAVIFDEFHERSLDADFGLALALDSSELRDDLRIVAMSATLDAAAVAETMGGAPVIRSEGRMFPVETRYVEIDARRGIEEPIARIVLQALAADAGSALVFLPGQAEILRTARLLEGRVPAGVKVAPLFGRLTPQEQAAAIEPAPAGRRKVVLATSIAETSLTIEGVRIVIDSGLSRRPEYEPATGLTRLVTRRVSRAAAEQRRGRAGRTEPGVCYRLWPEAQTPGLVAQDRPEILEADLSGLALDMARWGVTEPERLRFVDKPPAAAWAEAVSLLKTLGALDADGRLTPDGAKLARLPLHPRLAHMVVTAAAEGQAGMAAELAVLLGEPGLGGSDTDLGERLAQFRRDRGPRAGEARTLAARWAREAGGGTGRAEGGGAEIGRLVARAYPDRVAQAAGARGRFRLANGRAASIDARDPLADSDFLVVTDITGTAADGRIRAAARLERTDLDALFGASMITETAMSFDAGARSVRARRVTRLGALRLDEAVVPVSDPVAAAELLADSLGPAGIRDLAWSREQRTLRERASYLARTLGDPWPDLSDEALAASAGVTLAPHLIGRTRAGDVTADDLAGVLETMLPRPMRRELDALLPSHFEAPSGSRVPIDYEAEHGPALSIRVQELFGLDRHPSVAGGRLKLVLILLSPAQRPIQTTRDLSGFWRGSWRDVARELRGRYPRHNWPDDPLAAMATARAKPRGQG